MKFLFRTAFWLTIAIFFIPVDETSVPETAVTAEAEPVSAVEAATAAQAALDDMGGFCSRNPDVCEIGGRVAHTFALKARTGALWVYATLDRQLGGSGAPPAPAADPAGGSGTLTHADLEPAWTGPGVAPAPAPVPAAARVETPHSDI